MSKIVKSAIRYNDKVYTGFDHGECFKQIDKDTIKDYDKLEQGFITDKNEFVDRQQALDIAYKAGQIPYEKNNHCLISEDVHLYWLNDLQSQLDQLKQQLDEKDCRIEELEGQFAYECECNKQLVELQKQLAEKQNTIDEINKEFVQAVHDWKTLCAEKDTRIADLEDKDWYESCIKLLEKQNIWLIDTFKEKDKEIELLKHIGRRETTTEMFKENCKLIIEKRQLAIQELEKVKELLLDEYKKYPIVYDKTNDIVAGALDRDKVNEIIDQQIKLLKGEKDDG